MNHHPDEMRRRLLLEYARSPRAGVRETDRVFHRLFAGSLTLALSLGGLLLTVKTTPAARLTLFDPAPVAFRVAGDLSRRPAHQPAEERTASPEKPRVEPREKPREEPVPVIAPDTRLAQDVDSAPTGETDGPPVRRVYGVRKVFARGLGAGAGGNGDLVVKRGNTLDGRADTLTATEADLRGRPAPLSTVETPPAPIHQVKPRYSRVMLDHRVSGVVSARLLVDAGGSVREVEILDDLGFDSAEIAALALRQFRFRPARRADQPVAVWIHYKIRFEFQE